MQNKNPSKCLSIDGCIRYNFSYKNNLITYNLPNLAFLIYIWQVINFAVWK